MERDFHVCIMWQKEYGALSYSDAVVTTAFSPFNEKFIDYVKKAVAEKRNVKSDITEIVVLSMSRLD